MRISKFVCLSVLVGAFWSRLLFCADDTLALNPTGIKHGIYSGTFDPPTLAHNAIIRSAIKKLHLERLYIFVNKNGEKDCKCSAEERAEMLRRMLIDLEDIVVIVAQESDSKRADYLMIKKILKGPLIHITGEDSYSRRLLILSQNRVNFDAIAIIPRDFSGNSVGLKLEPNAFYLPIDADYEIRAVSSTKVRQKLAGRDYKDIPLTPEVLSYIIENGLYYKGDSVKDKELRYIENYYAYVGRYLSSCPPPEFDQLASEDSWKERFYKWVFIQNKGKINYAK